MRLKAKGDRRMNEIDRRKIDKDRRMVKRDG